MSTPGAKPIRSAESLRSDEARAYTLQAVAPQRFGKYTLIGKLGQGGMAEVLLGVASGKAGFRKLFVLKRLHAQLEGDPGFVDMFLDEARLAAQLDHPHCVHTVEVGEVDDIHFLAMEHLEGQGLERLLRSSVAHGEPLPVALVVRIIADVLDGLSYAHELEGFDGRPLGVVHRDISPQNLFITYAGVVKLLDFGIAKAETNVVETRTGVIKGKYAYMAPEQALGATIDARADVWSMGIVLWECLTSRRLFKSTNELATLHETLHAEVHPPSLLRDEVPGALDAIVMQALVREPNDRFQSAAEFKDALEGWLSTVPNPPARRHIAALMKERFEDVQRVQREKLVACLASLDVGPSALHRLVGEAAFGTGLRSGELGLGPDARADGDGRADPRSVTPTPTPSAVSYAASLHTTDRDRDAPEATRAGRPSQLRSGPAPAPAASERRWKWLALALVALCLVTLGVTISQGRDAASRMPTAPPSAPAAAAPVPPPTTVDAPLDGPLDAPVVAVVENPDSPPLPSPAEAPEPSAPRPPSPVSRTQPGGSSDGHEPPRGRDRTAGEDGYLSLVTSPWTTVSLGGRNLGETPLVRVRLPAGRHTLHLANPEAGISESYSVEITPGDTTTRRLGLR